MGVAVFDYATWAALYPELAATIAEPQAQAYFNQAGILYCLNTDEGIVCDVPTRLALLNMLVAHLAAISKRNAEAALVGRINSATEGGVTVAVEYAAPDDAAWFIQTPYGAAYWQASLPYRSAVYVPAPQSCYGQRWIGRGYDAGYGYDYGRARGW